MDAIWHYVGLILGVVLAAGVTTALGGLFIRRSNVLVLRSAVTDFEKGYAIRGAKIEELDQEIKRLTIEIRGVRTENQQLYRLNLELQIEIKSRDNENLTLRGQMAELQRDVSELQGKLKSLQGS